MRANEETEFAGAGFRIFPQETDPNRGC